MTLVAERVHRLPEALVLEEREFAVAREPRQRLVLPDRVVPVEVAPDLRCEHEEATVDPTSVPARLLAEAPHAVALDFEGPEAARGLHRCDGRERALLSVEGE